MGAAAICGLTYFNDYVIRQTFLIGTHMPIAVIGGLLLFLALNVGLLKLHKKLAFTGPELAIALGMTLVACCIPSTGLLRNFTATLLLPHHYAKTDTAWQRHRLTDEVMPQQMLADTRKTVFKGEIVEADSTSLTLAETASKKADAYDGLQVRILSDGPRQEVRMVDGYDASTRTLLLREPLRSTPEPGTLVRISKNNEEEALLPFLFGPTDDGDFAGIPWSAWARPLSFWVPVLFLVWFMVLGLAMVVHRQWSKHEHLPYPIANFANTLLPDSEGKVSSIFRDRRFWITAGVVFAIYINNYICAWAPNSWVSIPRHIDFSSLISTFEIRAWWLNKPVVYFSVVGIAFFLASDVSFSVGISCFVHAIVFGTILAGYGINIHEGDTSRINYRCFLDFGAYLGMALIILYTGRHYYFNVLKRSLFLKSDENLPDSSVWGARTAIVCLMGLVIMLGMVGLDWHLGIAYGIMLLLVWLVVGRIIAETGFFFFTVPWWPGAMLLGIIGARSLDLRTLCILSFLGCILVIGGRENLIAFAMNSLKVMELKKQGGKRTLVLCAAAVVIGLGVGLPTTLYFQYSRGMNSHDRWATLGAPRNAFSNVVRVTQRLEAQGVLASVDEDSPKLSGFLSIKPIRPGYIGWAALGIFLVVSVSLLRLRFTKFPIHPVLFLVWTMYGASMFSFAFFIGWILKTLVMRFGGARVYQSLKPVAIGLIAGEILGALLPIIVGVAYYVTTGDSPPKYNVFPG